MAAVGLGLLAWVAQWEHHFYWTLDRQGVRTTATIVHAQHYGRQSSYLIHFSRAPHAPADTWTGIAGEVGDVISVVYNPSDPSDAIASANLRRAELVIPSLLCAGALVCFVLGWRTVRS
ncbi:DUF3592 domain-containing protein [Streptacidiphilus jiangxiensis]|uniref:DUF3592 domain-containing protein n=1 Tax=Streptacidiphilus jiangxiensis TaxID=235985 RepID=UPI001160546B|nr:DUF3592 domain-containing protein [Streptacidiphilus jiangxiensis]